MGKRDIFKVRKSGKIISATLIATDSKNDLAILKIDVRQPDYLPLELAYRDAEKVKIYGYPLPNKFGTNLKVSEGNVEHQITSSYIRANEAMICPGNSGGPIVGTRGVVGVLTENVWPFDENGCAARSQGPTADKVAKLAAENGILYHEIGGARDITNVTDEEVLEIYAWK